MRDWHLVEQAFLNAAVGRTAWDDAMEVATHVTGSVGALLFPFPGRIADIPKSQAMAGPAEVYFRDGWHERDERFAGLAQLKTKGIATEFDFTSPELMKRSAYFEEFLRPFGLRWFAGVAIRSGSEVWSLSLQRSIEQGPFQEGELQALRQLSTRLDAAADLARALDMAHVKGASEAFEQSTTPVAFFDRAGRVISANGVCDRLFRNGDLRLVGGHIKLRSSTAGAKFDQGIGEVLSAGERLSSRILLIPRPTGRGLVARIIRFDASVENPMSLCQAVVIFHDLDHGPERKLQTWQLIFGLTPSECKLMEALQLGLSLEEAALKLNLSKETVRSRIKDIFGKTQTSRQGELLALFARFPG